MKPFWDPLTAISTPPLLHAEVDTGDRADAVDEEQRRVAQLVQEGAHRGDVAGDTGGGLVVANQHRLDRVGLVGLEMARVVSQRDAFAPRPVDRLDPQTVTLAEVDPEVRELAESGRQNAVAPATGCW